MIPAIDAEPRRVDLTADPRKVVFTFPSTHHAMAAEDALRRAGVWLQVIPVPAHLGGRCGLAVRVHGRDVAVARSLLEHASVLHHGQTPDGVD